MIRTLRVAAATLVLALGLSAPAHASGTDIRQISSVPMTCTVGSGVVGFNKSGSRVTLNVSVSRVTTGSGWRIAVTDSLAGVVARSSVAVTGSAWSAFVNYGSLKGTRTITVTAANTAGTDRCTGKLTYKV